MLNYLVIKSVAQVLQQYKIMMHMKAPAVIKQKLKQKNSTDIIRQILHYID